MEETFDRSTIADDYIKREAAEPNAYLTKEQLQARMRENRKNMEKAAMDMDFIQAAHFRDEIERIQNQLKTLA